MADVIDRFTQTIGFLKFAVYVFDYGAPTGLRLAVKHPERITAIISQNGNAYEEGLSDGWSPIRAYWQDASEANRKALREFLAPKTTYWQYTHGVSDTSRVSPDGYSLDNFYLARPGADEVQLDLFGDYKSNVALYPTFQKYFRTHKPPLLAVWGKNDPFFLPPGAEAFKRDIPSATVRFSIPDILLWRPCAGDSGGNPEVSPPLVEVVVAKLPTIVFDVNETLLDLETMTPIFERIFRERLAMRLWFANLIVYSEALTWQKCTFPLRRSGAQYCRCWLPPGGSRSRRRTKGN